MVLAECLSIKGNHQLLIRGDAANGNLAVIGTEDSLGGTTGAVLLSIHLNTHELQTLGCALTNLPLVLAGTTGEEDDIHTTHSGSILADVLLDTIGVHLSYQEVHLLSQTSLVVTIGNASQDVAEVAAALAYTSQTALFVQQVADALGIQVELIHQECNSTGIDIAAAGTHDKTLQRSQTHRGIHTLTVLNSSDAGTVANVASDNLLTLGLYTQELTYTLRDIAVACSVESVTANAILLVQLIRKGVHVGIVRHGLMECGIEHTYLGNVGQQGCYGIYALDVGGVMQRGQVIASCKGFHYLGGQANALVKLLTTVYHTMAYGIQLLKALQHSIFALGKHLEYPLYTGCVLGYGSLHLMLLAIQLNGYKTIGQAYLLYAAAGDDTLVIHVVQCVLNRTAPAVQDQYLHKIKIKE